MKHLFIILFSTLLLSCNSIELVENWKNPDIDSYQPYKVLVVGITSNNKARRKFEKQLKNELELRGATAVASIDFFDGSFRTEEMTEEELNTLENDLLKDGFDTILLTKIVGVEDKIAYKRNYDGYDESYIKFKQDYLMHQDIFYNPDYYEEYAIYHAETSMYCICPTKDRELIWKGYIDIVDPESINETIKEYVRLVIVVLEEQQLINPVVLYEEEINEEVL